MQHICAISGVAITRTRHFPGTVLTDIHPIFSMPKDKLFSDWTVKTFLKSTDVEEQRLLFLALLNATGLVKFAATMDATALPPKIVTKYFTRVYNAATHFNGRTYAWRAHQDLPKLFVSPLEGINGIVGWLDALDEYVDARWRAAEERTLHDIYAKEAAPLHKLIKTDAIAGLSDAKRYSYIKRLAMWACRAAGITNKHHVTVYFVDAVGTKTSKQVPQLSHTFKMLITPIEQAYKLNAENLKAVIEFLEVEIPYPGWPAYHAIIEHARELLKTCQLTTCDFSVLNLYAFDEEDTQEESALEASLNTVPTEPAIESVWTLHTINSEATSEPTAAPNIPPEPKREDYKNKLAYILAIASWKNAVAAAGRN